MDLYKLNKKPVCHCVLYSKYVFYIDLDLFILGEYTEYDTDHSNSEDENSKPSKKQKTSEKTSDQVKYKCPECSKVLKTISGFRGHVKKTA